jgi:DHA2 family multidrug resistance protein
MRNIGGSIGIAVTGTMLVRQQQAVTTLLGSHVSAYDPASQAMFARIRGGFIAGGADPVTATSRTYAALFGTVWRQASMVSFVTIFQILGLVFIALIPLVLIMKRPAHQAAPPMAH